MNPPLAQSQDPYVSDRGRLAALEASGLLSAEFSPSLDRWTRLASGLLGTPIALLSMVTADRQYFKSQVGLGAKDAAQRGTPLSHSFCQHVVSSQQPLIVSDAREDPVLCDNPAITALDVIAYAGLPVMTSDGHTLGAFCVIDHTPHEWSTQELGLLEDLAAGLSAEIQLRTALAKAAGLEAELMHQARVDALTGLPNRRQLGDDLVAAVGRADSSVLAVFDLDGFKTYNDTFGHPAGDALLTRMAVRLRDAVQGEGTAYRLGGDEFCVIADGTAPVTRAAAALQERGASFAITNSHGYVQLRDETLNAEAALQLADERLYRHKHGRSTAARRQAHDVLLSVLRESEPDVSDHVHQVAELARAVGERLELSAPALEELTHAAHMHDIGKVAIPDSILHKPGPLTAEEWAMMRQHTVLGERILRAAPALSGVAAIVRSSHERWDGGGYPDGLTAADIPLAARIILACDAVHAITGERAYRARRPLDEAITELRNQSGRQLDPDVARHLAAHLEQQPAATS